MANQEHLDILQQGVEVWNQWRSRQYRYFRPDLSGVDLKGVDLAGVHLSRANLRNSYLIGANLSRANLSETDLSEAHLSRAHLSRAHLSKARLVEARLIEADLVGADFRDANLTRAHLAGADLSEADLSGANLSEADLSEVNFVRTNLSETNLARADLARAHFFKTNLFGADLRGAILSRATIGLTVLGKVDLREVKGLESVEHIGPSSVGIDTIYRSQGSIPEYFLKGAGVDNTFITYVRSLVGKAIEYYSCFISYSSRDEAFAHRLYADLQNSNVRCWYAPEHLKIGDKFRLRIDESIRVYDKLLLVLSESSLASSWVSYEVEKALDKEPEGKPNVLFPIRLDKAILTCETDWAKEIRKTRHIGDFERWKDHDSYQVAFGRLLRDLKAQS